MKNTDTSYKRIRKIWFGAMVAVFSLFSLITIMQFSRVDQNNLRTTSVLGATSFKGLKPLSAVSWTYSTYLVTVTNTSKSTVEFSPGLQLFAVLADGTEVQINRLGQVKPLNGGPIEPGATMSGSVEFGTTERIVAIRTYETPDRQTYNELKL